MKEWNVVATVVDCIWANTAEDAQNTLLAMLASDGYETVDLLGADAAPMEMDR